MKKAKQVQWGSVAISVEGLSFTNRLFIASSLLGVLVWAFPHVAFAHTLGQAPMIFEINNFFVFDLPTEDYLARFLAADKPVPPPDPRVEKLREYLSNKNSILAAESEVLLTQYHYRLILGVSFAESNFCKHQITPNNCWGIGGGRPESYQTLEEGIIRTNNLIHKYQELGMTRPKFMRDSWVGWPNDNWIIAVEQITQELEENGL